MKWSRIFLTLCVLGLSASGIALFVLKPDDEWAMPHPWNGTLRMIHGWLVILALMVLGSFIQEHVRKKWRKARSHIDGVLHLVSWLGLAISGGLLYYPPQNWPQSLPVSTLHWYLGVFMCSVLVLHISRYWLSLRR